MSDELTFYVRTLETTPGQEWWIECCTDGLFDSKTLWDNGPLYEKPDNEAMRSFGEACASERGPVVLVGPDWKPAPEKPLGFREGIMARAADQAMYAFRLTQHCTNRYALQDERSMVTRFELLQLREKARQEAIAEVEYLEAIAEVEYLFDRSLQEALLEMIPSGALVEDGAAELERLENMDLLERRDHEGGMLFLYAGKPVLWAGPFRTRLDDEGKIRVSRALRRL